MNFTNHKQRGKNPRDNWETGEINGRKYMDNQMDASTCQTLLQRVLALPHFYGAETEEV
jgi:hypothetical protein